jgi:mono/diheme cytochrome c family protein
MRYSAILLIVILAACGGGDGAPPADEAQQPAAQTAPAAVASTMDLPEGVTPAMVAEGETIFMGPGICYTCHTQGGVGGPLAPDLTDDVWLNIDGSYDAIVQTVTNGVPEPKEHPGLMLPKGGSSITDEQVRAVAAYVWSLSHGG